MLNRKRQPINSGRLGIYMEKLKSALNAALKREGLDRAVRQSEALFIWEEVVGRSVAKNCTPEEVKHGILIVRALTPVW